jgi:cobalamin biosynthesis protein CobD/CbiB
MENCAKQEFEHCNRVALLERVAKDAKAVLEARKKLMNLMGRNAEWDKQQDVVQAAVKQMEDSVRDAEIAGLFIT